MAIALTGLILGAGGYAANLAEQSQGALGAIRLIIGPIPAVIFIAAIILIDRYPIDEATYNAIVGKKSSA